MRKAAIAIVAWLFSAAVAVAEPAVKPPIRGLISMGHMTCFNHEPAMGAPCIPDNSLADVFGAPGLMSAAVVNVTWAQLQPDGPDRVTTVPIDAAITLAARYNATHPARPLRLILRVSSASNAPGWVKALAGGPVSTVYRSNQQPITVPRFWTQPYRQAWRALEQQLAARYDREPLIAQVSDTSCSHQTDEPYINPIDPASIEALFAAGYTNEAYYDCLRNSVHDYDDWKSTPIDFTQNVFENLNLEHGKGRFRPGDMSKTVAIMRFFRSTLGSRAVLSNHNLKVPPFPGNIKLNTAIRTLGPPIQFQTASPDYRMTDWNESIESGVALGADAIEIWPSFTFKGRLILNGWNAVTCGDGASCGGQPREVVEHWASMIELGRASK
ncbi:MAG: hypothetical protein ACXWKO_11010 [Phenylobacterium sp.]